MTITENTLIYLPVYAGQAQPCWHVYHISKTEDPVTGTYAHDTKSILLFGGKDWVEWQDLSEVFENPLVKTEETQ